MLSEFRRFAVRDADGKRASVADLQVDLAAGDYPRATGLILGHRGSAGPRLDWAHVRTVDPRARHILVDSLDGEPITDTLAAHAVFLIRDVLDAEPQEHLKNP